MVKLLTIFLALSLPCAGMLAVFVLYSCLVWFATYTTTQAEPPPVPVKGFSASDLKKLPKTIGKELTRAVECALCLDDIEAEQLARVIPGCKL
ncbi:hypothetical protein ACLB2K_034574 [Fragaria x ananassa]